MVYALPCRILAIIALLALRPQPVWGAECGWITEGLGKPEPALPAAHPELCRTGFLLSYNPDTKVADWVMERLIPQRLDGPASRQRENFRPDPALPPDAQAALSDYRGSGFDRGHLAPAADLKWDEAAMAEGFYLTNVAPQVGPGFNRGIWAALEAEIRNRAKNGELAVVTGPVYFDYEPVIGPGRVAVPDAFFKAVYDVAGGETRAWLVPNRAMPGAKLDGFAIPLARLEALTGLDFFPAKNLQIPGENSAPPP